jgi:CubicO group peptidase (beta-lactamase class C family)
MAHLKIPGLAVGIYSRGEILVVKGDGQANVELGVPVKPETVLQTGSVGKQFVSAAIMMLVQEGKISLDDSFTKYFPDAPATWKPILIKKLLSHTSGLSECESEDRTGPKGPYYMRLDFTEDELAPKSRRCPSHRRPAKHGITATRTIYCLACSSIKSPAEANRTWKQRPVPFAPYNS